MNQGWTFGKRLTLAIGGVALLAILMSGLAIFAIRTTVAAEERVTSVGAKRRLDVESMRVARERRAKLVRSYLISAEPRFAKEMGDARDALATDLARLRDTAEGPEEMAAIDRVAKANALMQGAWDKLMQSRKAGSLLEALVGEFDGAQAYVDELNDAMSALANLETSRLEAQQSEASARAAHLNTLVLLSAAAVSMFAAAAAFLLSRGLTRQVGDALTKVQKSSSDLQTAAHQQVSTTQELASTTTEIATTIRELLATSKQIAESSRRVVQIAEETGSSATAGDDAVKRAQEAILGIREQVDQIVNRMVHLGKKSQQIGGILDVINELAEQTNILSINATIEAAGAGESGRRFATVANEIRRLADRVSVAAREIRDLVDEVRSAANATLMATENGSKTVDAGAQRFGDVLSTFEKITERVVVTVEAAREIELSTKQQTSAVEQVNQAINGVRQAATETQTSSRQTLSTCSELALVSQQLTVLIRPSGPLAN